MGRLKIGQLAELTGCTVKAIRFYEAKGLLPRPHRSPSGYRLYTERDLKRLQFIKRAKLIGLPLSKIWELVLHLSEGECACPDRTHWQGLIRDQLKDISVKLDQLTALREELSGFLVKVRRAKQGVPEELCTCPPGPEVASSQPLQIRRKGQSTGRHPA